MNPMCFRSGLAADYRKRAKVSEGADSTLNCPGAGFTLIELLVVIAIIAILAAVLLPVLAHAKLKATQAYCVNNQKELATAWIMYVSDNKDSLPLGYNSSWGSAWPGTSPAGGFWGVNKSFPPFTGAGASQGAAMQNIQSCLMTNNLFFQYAGNVGTYHCPGDVRFNQPIGSGGSIDWAYDSYAIPENVEPDSTAQETSTSFTKMANIHRVADCMIFVEQADPRGYNEGTFEISAGPLPSVQPISYTDIFSMYHGDVGTFSFADGHAEAHRWHDGNIIADGLASVAPGSALDQYSVCPVQPLQKGIDAGYLVQHVVDQTNP
jgi:prepilin-type N-terminal cleavage/methylation domain-containing protein/prepilin-type processing-associated H-X9-DG protein